MYVVALVVVVGVVVVVVAVVLCFRFDLTMVRKACWHGPCAEWTIG